MTDRITITYGQNWNGNIPAMQRRISELEAKNASLDAENAYLKRMLLDESTAPENLPAWVRYGIGDLD
jgi:hypothetical protein